MSRKWVYSYFNVGSAVVKGESSMFLSRKRNALKRLKTPKSQELFPHFDKSIKLYNQAVRLEKEGKIDEAIEIYLENVKRYKTPGIAHFERPAILLEKQGRYKEAIKVCDMALKLKAVHKPTAEQFQRNFSAGKRRLKGFTA